MHPVARKWLASQALCLGDLILMMRENQVIAAAVNVDLLANAPG